jgi:hypothetical protein
MVVGLLQEQALPASRAYGGDSADHPMGTGNVERQVAKVRAV